MINTSLKARYLPAVVLEATTVAATVLTRTLVVVAAGLLLLCTACSSTHFQSRTNPDAALSPLVRSVVVIAVDERAEVRTMFEQKLVNRFKERQVQAFASHSQFALSDLKLSQAEIRQKLSAWNVEAVLIARVTDRDSFAHQDTLGGTLGPSTTWFDVDQARMTLYGDGDEIHTELRLETRLYRLDNATLQWVAYVDTFLNESTDRLERADQVTRKIVAQLARDRIIP